MFFVLLLLASQNLSFQPHPTIDVGDQVLSLRASMVKEATILKVSVYQIDMYVSNEIPPRTSANQASTKAFLLTFLRNIKAEKLASSWLQDLQLYCETNCETLLKQARPVANALPEMEKGSTVLYVVRPTSVEVLVNGKPFGTISGAAASQTVSDAFLGPKAPKDVRKALVLEPRRE